MAGKLDQAEGRTKEAIGDLTDDPELKREGTVDRLGGELKEKLGDLADKGSDLVDDAKDALQRHQNG